MKPMTITEADAALHARIWEKNIAANPGDDRWVRWRDEAFANRVSGRSRTFLALNGDEPVGEGTLLFSPECSAIRGRFCLADGARTANINALRIEKPFEGQGHVSRLVRRMEQAAREAGMECLTIGVEAKETRNLAIYLHWGYDRFVMSEAEDGELVLYYAKQLV